MSKPHIEHFVDERGNFIYRAEFEGSFLSKDEAKELAKYVSGVLDENAKLRELCRHLYMCNQYCDREDSNGGCSACPYKLLEYDCGFEERLLKLGIEVDA